MRSPIQLGVSIFLLRKDGKILVLKHADDKLFRCPGGAREPGEQPAQSAARELAEEVGVSLDPDQLSLLHVETTTHEKYGEWLTVHFVAAVTEQLEPVNLEPELHTEIMWVDLFSIAHHTGNQKHFFEPTVKGAKALHKRFGRDLRHM